MPVIRLQVFEISQREFRRSVLPSQMNLSERNLVFKRRDTRIIQES